MVSDTTIHWATVSDIPALLRLYTHLTGEYPCSLDKAEAQVQALHLYKGSGILIATRDGEVVSSVTLVVIPNLTRGSRPYGLIENVVTAPEWRGRGIATALLDAAVERAWDADCYKVMLLTGSSDVAVMNFYERAGFEQSKTGFQKRRIPKRAL